jgi:hypothetical protein
MQNRVKFGVDSTYSLLLCTFDYGDYLAQSSSNVPNETSREGVSAWRGDVSAAGKPG